MTLFAVGSRVTVKPSKCTKEWKCLKGKVAVVTGHDDTPRECTYYELSWYDPDIAADEDFSEMPADVFMSADAKPSKKKPLKEPGFTVEYESVHARVEEEDRFAAAEADAAALREVLEDCHIHNEYTRVGAKHADRLKRLKYYGRPHDASAAEHETAVGMALSGAAGRKLLAEVRDFRDGNVPEFVGETLLTRRQNELKLLTDDLLVRADMLRKCVEGGFCDVNERLRDLATVAHDARLVAAKVDDLRDVEKYGKGGGR